MGMIEAVKALRAATAELELAYPDGTIGLTLKDAKRIAFALAPMLATNERMQALEDARRAADAADAAYAAHAAHADARRQANIQICGIIRAIVGMDGTTTPHAGA